WKWDGLRAQLVKRGDVWLWSRRDELITDSYPEIVKRARELPDGTVLDGEVVAYDDGPLPFGALQERMGREDPSRKVQRTNPVVFKPFDVLECEGVDMRGEPLERRRSVLEELVADVFAPSRAVTVQSWDEAASLREDSRDRGFEGFVLKRLDAEYVDGRQRGYWWKWKVDPLELDTILLYAQMGHGKRGNIFSDYTLGVWNGDELVPVAKAYSGLTDEELEEMDAWIRSHTEEKYGPVRSVPPEHVFELQFDGIVASDRKAGASLRFPRINRWRRDLSPDDADSLDRVHDLLRRYGNAGERDSRLDDFM
ncbi:MAG: ATP-dependent DNA ligase, partial [Halobacteriaceae archaeon]